MTYKDDAMSIATEIKVWMARRRMTQAELAKAVGHDQTWVSKRLSGKIPLDVEDVLALADALNVRAVDFFRLDDGGGWTDGRSINYRSA